MIIEEKKEKTKFSADYKLAAAIFGGFVLLFLFAFAAYYFNIELTDL